MKIDELTGKNFIIKDNCPICKKYIKYTAYTITIFRENKCIFCPECPECGILFMPKKE